MSLTFKENVLGTDYIVKVGEKEDIGLKDSLLGECEIFQKVIRVTHSSDGEDRELEDEARDLRTREIIVHEVCHAFVNESGVSMTEEEEEKMCGFLMKNFRKISNVVLDLWDKLQLID